MKTMLRGAVLALSLGLAIGTGGCSTLLGIFGSTTTAGANDVTTLSDAVLAADLATKGAKWYVDNYNPPATTLQQINTYNESVHTALVDLENAQKAGQSLNFAAFNAALDAFNVWKQQNNIPSPPTH